MKTFDKFALDAKALKHVSGGASQEAMNQIANGVNNPNGIMDFGFTELISDETGKDIDEVVEFITSIKKKKNRWG